jgi:hypothetical protein
MLNQARLIGTAAPKPKWHGAGPLWPMAYRRSTGGEHFYLSLNPSINPSLSPPFVSVAAVLFSS